MNYHTDRGHAMHNSYRDHPDEPGWRILKEKYGLDINTMKPDEFSRAFEKFIIAQLHKANDDPDTIDSFFGEGEEKEILNLFCGEDAGFREIAEKLKACAQLKKTLLVRKPDAPSDFHNQKEQSLERLKAFKAQLDKPSVLEKNRNGPWDKCLAAISFLLLPIAALRALDSYARHGTARFWVSQGKKVKTQLQEILEENVPPDEKSSPKTPG